ncbi:helix-turn-helix domain-containing protein [Geminicoccaceae bacterium 1502E]|nr:helix-turn-helix domain-containing protein [Geminicoccaceae bacterium 1502E]
MKRARPYDREAALDAALMLFWKKGYQATSLKDLEAGLAMKPGSIYAAFSSKEALFALALERYFEKNRDALRTRFLQAPSPLAALADHLRSIARSEADDPHCRACMLVKTLLAATPEDAAIAARAQRYLDAMKTEIAAAFERARRQGELQASADPDRLARRYQSNLTALRIEAHRGLADKELTALAEEMAQEVERLRAAVSGKRHAPEGQSAVRESDPPT